MDLLTNERIASAVAIESTQLLRVKRNYLVKLRPKNLQEEISKDYKMLIQMLPKSGYQNIIINLKNILAGNPGHHYKKGDIIQEPYVKMNEIIFFISGSAVVDTLIDQHFVEKLKTKELPSELGFGWENLSKHTPPPAVDAMLSRYPKQPPIGICNLGEGEIFGEECLIGNHNYISPFKITCNSDSMRVYLVKAIELQSFLPGMILDGLIEEFMRKKRFIYTILKRTIVKRIKQHLGLELTKIKEAYLEEQAKIEATLKKLKNDMDSRPDTVIEIDGSDTDFRKISRFDNPSNFKRNSILRKKNPESKKQIALKRASKIYYCTDDSLKISPSKALPKLVPESRNLSLDLAHVEASVKEYLINPETWREHKPKKKEYVNLSSYGYDGLVWVCSSDRKRDEKIRPTVPDNVPTDKKIKLNPFYQIQERIRSTSKKKIMLSSIKPIRWRAQSEDLASNMITQTVFRDTRRDARIAIEHDLIQDHILKLQMKRRRDACARISAN